MFVRLSAAIAAVSLLSGAAFAQGAKPTDPQIAHIAYTAGVIDITAAKQALKKSKQQGSPGLSPRTWCATMRPSTSRRWRW